jgi:hypothetical protein
MFKENEQKPEKCVDYKGDNFELFNFLHRKGRFMSFNTHITSFFAQNLMADI